MTRLLFLALALALALADAFPATVPPIASATRTSRCSLLKSNGSLDCQIRRRAYSSTLRNPSIGRGTFLTAAAEGSHASNSLVSLIFTRIQCSRTRARRAAVIDGRQLPRLDQLHIDRSNALTSWCGGIKPLPTGSRNIEFDGRSKPQHLRGRSSSLGVIRHHIIMGFVSLPRHCFWSMPRRHSPVA